MKRVLLAGLVCALTVAHAAEPLVPEQFNWQQPIRIETPGEAIYRFDLPAEVHAGSRRHDLGDIRVFNGAGEVVPHALIDDEPPTRTDTAQTPAAFFPLRREDKAGNGALSVSVRQIAGGALVSTSANSNAPAQARLLGYVVDASAITNSRRALLLNWQPQPNGTVLPVRVDGGDDLQTWQAIGSETQLVDLRSGEQHLQQRRIDLAGSAHKYFRIRWPEIQDGIVVASVAIETSSTAERPDRMRWTSTGTVSPGNAPGEFLFESAALPVAALRLNLPEINTVVPLQIQHRRSESDTWREAANTVAYRVMRNNQEVRSPEIHLCCSTDRYWRIEFDQRGGGIGRAAPRIDLGWIPQQGMFVARGPAPFQLAYGNATVAPATFAAATLVPDYRPEQYPAFAEARFDLAVARAAPAVTEVAQAGLNWRTVALWSVLIGGVLLLAAMVWRLLRQMGQSSGPAPD